LLTARGTPGAAQEVVVFDVGLGGAANAVAALQTAQRLRQSAGKVRPLRVVSFESDIAAPRFALEHADTLVYLDGFESALRTLIDQRRWTSGDGLSWELREGDFPRLVEEEPSRADAVFFDPFSPRSNPAMWSVPLLENLYRCRRPGRPMALATYSSAFGVRAALLLAGFYVGDGPVLSGTRHATLASTDFSALQQPLDRAWLARWRRDHEPWPPLTPPERHREIREALLAHPQWEQFDGEAASTDDASPTPAPRKRHRRR
jgi:hypothetical protein